MLVVSECTEMILNICKDRSGQTCQTVQTHFRLLLEELSDQCLHCLPFHMYFFDKIYDDLALIFEFLVNYTKFSSF